MFNIFHAFYTLCSVCWRVGREGMFSNDGNAQEIRLDGYGLKWLLVVNQ